MVAAAIDVGKHAPPTEGEKGTTKDNAGRSPPTEDKLLLACCRAIKKESGWQERTLRQACDWATGVCDMLGAHERLANVFFMCVVGGIANVPLLTLLRQLSRSR